MAHRLRSDRVARIVSTVVTIALIVGATGCYDNADIRLKARVVSIDSSQVCVQVFPGRLEGYEEYSTCYPYSPRDSDRLEVGACISARFPWPGAKPRFEKPIYELKVLATEDCRQ